VACVKVLAGVSRGIAPACAALALSSFGAFGCVPEERPGGPSPVPSQSIEVAPRAEYRSVPRVILSAPKKAAESALLQQPYEDNFERVNLGGNYLATSPAWKLEAGRLCASGARNRPVWFLRRLPTNARIEFDALSYSDDGDIKVELFGDGSSFATTSSYTDATGYILVYGGWRNTLHVLARHDEHGKDRVALAVDGLTARTRPVEPGRSYRFRIERQDGRTVRFWVDAEEILQFLDQKPLFGSKHDHFAFKAWLARVCFDNLKVVPLGS